MKYSKKDTVELAHFIGMQHCIKDINYLISKDGCEELMPFFKNDEQILDMDYVEKVVASVEKRILNKSMDSSFVLSADEEIKIVFVEFRFNYLNMKNVRADDLTEKKIYSCKIWFDKGFVNFYENYYYVFNKDFIEQGRRRLRNLYPRVPNNFVACTIQDIKDTFF